MLMYASTYQGTPRGKVDLQSIFRPASIASEAESSNLQPDELGILDDISMDDSSTSDPYAPPAVASAPPPISLSKDVRLQQMRLLCNKWSRLNPQVEDAIRNHDPSLDPLVSQTVHRIVTLNEELVHAVAAANRGQIFLAPVSTGPAAVGRPQTARIDHHGGLVPKKRRQPTKTTLRPPYSAGRSADPSKVAAKAG